MDETGGARLQGSAPTGAGGHAAMEMMREDTLDKRAATNKTASLWLDAWMVSLINIVSVSTPAASTEGTPFLPSIL